MLFKSYLIKFLIINEWITLILFNLFCSTVFQLFCFNCFQLFFSNTNFCPHVLMLLSPCLMIHYSPHSTHRSLNKTPIATHTIYKSLSFSIYIYIHMRRQPVQSNMCRMLFPCPACVCATLLIFPSLQHRSF